MNKSIAEFLSYLSDLDIQLWVEGTHLRCNAPKGALTPTLRVQMAEYKAEILTFLSSQQSHDQADNDSAHQALMTQKKQINQSHLSNNKQEIIKKMLRDVNNKNISHTERKQNTKYLYDLVNQDIESTIFASQSIYLNYGYVANEDPQYALVDLPKHTINKNSIKLVLETIGDSDLTNCTILDVGCGRGGTIDIIDKYFCAKKIIGIDLSSSAIAFCRTNFSYPHVHFIEGDAEKLPFEENKFDVVINIESSHNYPDISKFYTGVYKVLKREGYFLYADFFTNDNLENCLTNLQESGFIVEKDRDITTNILLSCDELAAIKIAAYSNSNTSQLLSNFLALPGTKFYIDMENRTQIYKIFKLKKQGRI